MEILGRRGRSDVALRHVGDPHPEVRIAAAHALAGDRSAETRAALRFLAEDDDPAVRNAAATILDSASPRCHTPRRLPMFQRILLAWDDDNPPDASLRAARSLADAYGAELTVCYFGEEAAEARAAAGADALIEALSPQHAARELAAYAHEHGFDLIVIGRQPGQHLLGRHLLDDVDCPVLVVAEGVAASP